MSKAKTKTVGPMPAKLRAMSTPIDTLVLDPDNARLHDERNLNAISASLSQFGWRAFIVVRRSDRVVLAGNGRTIAAQQLGWTHAPVMFVSDEEAASRAYAIADNRTAELADWDMPKLTQQLQDLGSFEDLFAATGFTAEDFDALTESVGEESAPDDEAEEEAELPPLPAAPISKAGTLWALGNHRLLCGDCRNPADMTRLMDGAKINVAFTSPPYASQRKYDESSGFKPIKPDDFVEWFDAVQSGVKDCLADDGSWFVNIKEHCEDGQRSLYVKDLTLAHVRQWGWAFIDEFVWTKSGVPGKWPNRFKNAWEPVFHFAATSTVKLRHEHVSHPSEDLIDYHPDNPKTHSGFISSGGGDQGRRAGMALPSNVLTIHNSAKQTDTGATKHDATFPVGLPSFFVKAFSDEGDSIFDPFMGSGTTLIAAEQLGRKCYGMEISPGYCDIIVKRWENLTGKTARRVVARKTKKK